MPTDHASVKAGSADAHGPGERGQRRTRLTRGLRTWRRSEGGATAVEFAFVLPVLLMILAGIIQFGAIFFLQNNMANAAREAARALAVGSIETASQTSDLVDQKLVNWGVNFTVNTTMPDPDDPTDTDFTVVITAPLSEAAIFDYLGVFKSGTLRASASMREES